MRPIASIEQRCHFLVGVIGQFFMRKAIAVGWVVDQAVMIEWVLGKGCDVARFEITSLKDQVPKDLVNAQGQGSHIGFYQTAGLFLL